MSKLSRFVNSLRVTFQGGKGGDGCISMLSVFGNEFAGPDGGNGGNGGHVVLKANSMIKSLNSIQSNYRGLPGVRGMGKNLYGANAEHLIVDVPVNTLVAKVPVEKDLAEHEYDPELSDIVAELDEEGSMFIAARGGMGGRGNASYLSNNNRRPRVAEAGAEGERNVFELRLNLYANIGLIGLPNVGKSSLLKALTNANVRIGDYDFTTLHPQVGTIDFESDLTQMTIADLPGLIEESHNNRGLGLRFLRHVKQCACLLYIVDLSRERPWRQLEILFKELDIYKKGLSSRPHIVAGNKCDLPDSAKNMDSVIKFLAECRPGSLFLPISSVRGDNLETLRLEMKRMLDENCRNKDL